ncbi:MAG: protease modulator HflC [Xanthomonadales bacterium]|nr:protease modulator HflC [Xanthomonadales bacterium]
MKGLGIIGAAAVLVLIYLSAFTVSEIEYAAKFRLGEIIRTDFEPGLHWQLPIVNNVRKFDRRILSLDAPPQRFITLEKKDVIVDSFVKWRITDVQNFYTATSGGDQVRARARLSQIIADGLRTEFAKRNLAEVISTEREEIMANLVISANAVAASLGIEVVDVRVKRIDLPDEVSSSVFNRMRAERTEVANELRSQGREQSEKIRADADRQATVLVAEAQRDGERIRGEGEAVAADLYATAYDRNREFYSFYRSLLAYRKTFQGGSDLMLMDSTSEFFDYFGTQRDEDN